MKHREANHCVKPAAREWHFRGIPAQYGYILVQRATTKRFSEFEVDFQTGERRNTASEEICCRSVSWTYFQNIGPKVQTLQRPRQGILRYCLLPSR
jgi:hypothetical protein